MSTSRETCASDVARSSEELQPGDFSTCMMRVPFPSPRKAPNAPKIYEQNGVGLFTNGRHRFVCPIMNNRYCQPLTAEQGGSSDRAIEVITLSDDDDTRSTVTFSSLNSTCNAAESPQSQQQQARSITDSTERDQPHSQLPTKTNRSANRRPQPKEADTGTADFADGEEEVEEEEEEDEEEEEEELSDERQKRNEKIRERCARIYKRADLRFQKAVLLRQIEEIKVRLGMIPPKSKRHRQKKS